MKTCTRCKISKQDEAFRKRFSRYKDKKYFFLNSTCRECDKELALDYYWKHRTPERLAKNAARTKVYNAARKTELKEKRRQKRNTPEYKKYMKEYRERRKEIIFKQEVVTKKRYHEKHRDAISDKYVTAVLRSNGEQNPNPDRIEIKRVEILKKRIRLEILKKQKDG